MPPTGEDVAETVAAEEGESGALSVGVAVAVAAPPGDADADCVPPSSTDTVATLEGLGAALTELVARDDGEEDCERTLGEALTEIEMEEVAVTVAVKRALRVPPPAASPLVGLAVSVRALLARPDAVT